MHNLSKLFGRVLIGILILTVILAGGGFYYVTSYLPNTVAPKSFPQVDGEIQLQGLDAQVDIYRDAMGIPHIYATTTHDLFFAQGYVHAQERFWQMDFYRHVGEGRTAEMFGEEPVETDAFIKTLGWQNASEREYENFTDESKAILNAYADGVNAYLKDHDKEAVSLEYAILGLLSPDYKIEAWTPLHTLAWAKALAWDLHSNLDEEIERTILLKTLSPEQVAELFPPYPNDHPVIVNNIGDGSSANRTTTSVAIDIPDETLATLQHNASLLDRTLGEMGEGIGSNSWVVSGERTTTGMPLLANDPHLGIQMPSIWYQVAMHCLPKTDECPYEVAGFSLAGAPGIVLGHNADIAWGFTFAYEDVMDLYIEKVNPENPNQYEVDGEWVDFETRTETINVVGGEPVELTVQSTKHGPVISEVFGPLKNEGDPNDDEFVPFTERSGIELPENYVIAVSWTAIQTGNPFEAIFGFNNAKNWEEFREAASLFHTPGHNLTYADTAGNIAYQTSGDVPIRKNGDGALPSPGWTSECDWVGFIPFEELPYTLNPAEGYIASVNNKIVGDEYSYLLTNDADWDYGFRANRIVEMLENTPSKIDIAYFQQMQADAYDASASVLVPILLEMNLNDAHLTNIQALLNNWDYQAQADSTPAAVYEVFWKHLLIETFNDDLPENYAPSGGNRYFEIMRNIKPDSAWWDDQSTSDVVETREDIFIRAFTKAVAELEETLGKDSTQWKWGDLHVAIFRNGTLGESGIAPIESLFNRGPFGTGGGNSIVNATAWDLQESYEVTDLPSMRAIYDLSNLNNSLTVHTTGQSGHAYHPQYDDMAQLWADVSYYPMWWEQESAISNSEAHLILLP